MGESVRRHWGLGLVLVIALACRVLAAVAVEQRVTARGESPFLIPGDAEGYWDLAQDLREGREFAVYSPPRRVMRTPGFPLLLAGLMSLVGERLWILRCGLAIVGTIGCAAVYVLGRPIVGRPVALGATAIVALSPTMTVFSVLVLSETAFATTMTLALAASVRWFQAAIDGISTERAVRWGAIAGIAHAITFYVRPSWVLAPLLLAGLLVVCFARNRRGLFSSAALLAALLLSLMPWWIRNYHVTGHFVPTTLWVGPSLYDGLNPDATGDSNMQFFDRDQLLNSMSEYEMDQEYRRRAIEFAAENPGRAAWLFVRKSMRYWSLWPNAEQFSSLGVRLGVLLFNAPLLFLAAFGVWSARKQRLLVLFAAGPVLYFWLIHGVFVGSLRYRLPAEYPLAIVAAAGAVWLRRRCQKRDVTFAPPRRETAE